MRDFSLKSSERLTSLQPKDADLYHAEHYHFAASHLAAKNYRFGLDLFCGAGYGTIILAEKLPLVVLGIDGSGEAIAEAARCVGFSNALFTHKVFPFSLPKAWADFIVSFETIANLEHYEGFARLLAHTLAPGGTLILSAPNEERLPLARNRFPRQNGLPLATEQILWHIRHFRPHEIITMFEAHNLTLKQMLSSHFSASKDGHAIQRNGFSPSASALKPGTGDDEVVYIFEKTSA